MLKATFMHFLCSHLVRIRPRQWREAPETVLLEEISPDGVVLSTPRRYPKGSRFVVSAEGFEADFEIAKCEARDDAYVVRGRFREGFRWSPAKWTPAHLLELKPAAKAKAAGAS